MDIEQFLESGKVIELDRRVGNEPLCIVDSSFNPPNNAHLRLAKLGLSEFPGSIVVLMLATGNADKPAASPSQLSQRIEMMKLMAKEIDPTGERVRLALVSAPFFVDKAAALRTLGSNRLIFLVGYDTLVRFVDQKYYTKPVSEVLDNYFSTAEIMALTRSGLTPGGDAELSDQAASAESLVGKHAAKCHIVLSTEETDDVSSTRARQSLEGLKSCCPKSIVDYARNIY